MIIEKKNLEEKINDAKNIYTIILSYYRKNFGDLDTFKRIYMNTDIPSIKKALDEMLKEDGLTVTEDGEIVEVDEYEID